MYQVGIDHLYTIVLFDKKLNKDSEDIIFNQSRVNNCGGLNI